MVGRVALLAVALGACSDGAATRATSTASIGSARAVAPSADREPDGAAMDAAVESDSPADLVDVASIDPTIQIDMRYATPDNFTRVAFYPAARCLLRRDAAERLSRVQRRLSSRGLGLKVWDCYRPFSFQKLLWKLVSDPRYVAEPVADADGRPVKGSKHNRGAAVDLTLVDAAGAPVPMPTEHDDFSERAHRDSPDVPARARASSQILERAMVAEGFSPLPTEWWHFDAPGWERYPLSDQPLARPSR